jgi:heptosyltransferase-2
LNSFRGKILVIRGGAIGDFILTLPAIAALRQAFPAAHLEVLGYSHIVELAVAGGIADRAQAIDARPLAAFFARHGELSEEMRDYFSEFDLIISYLYDPDEIFQTNVRRCSPAQFIAGPHRPEERTGIHATKVFLRPLERLAIFDADSVPRLKIGNTNADANDLTPKTEDTPTLALHPGSGSELKNWPQDRWAHLLEWLLNETRFRLLMVGGEAEGQRLQNLAAALPPARTRVAQNQPLAELAARLASCSGFIGHDSGISHLAAALDLPGLLLWGDTAEEIWRPPSGRVALVRAPGGLAALRLDDVIEQVRRLWGAVLVTSAQ